jgi:hypothetical protein
MHSICVRLINLVEELNHLDDRMHSLEGSGSVLINVENAKQLMRCL